MEYLTDYQKYNLLTGTIESDRNENQPFGKTKRATFANAPQKDNNSNSKVKFVF